MLVFGNCVNDHRMVLSFKQVGVIYMVSTWTKRN